VGKTPRRQQCLSVYSRRLSLHALMAERGNSAATPLETKEGEPQGTPMSLLRKDVR